VLYELLTGAPPFTADDPLTLLYRHVETSPVPPSTLVPGLDPAVDAVVLRALAKDPADRFQSAAEMRAALGAAARGERTAALAADVFAPYPDALDEAADPGGLPEPARAARWPVAVGAVVVAAGLIVAGVAALGGATSPGTARAAGTTASAAASGASSAPASEAASGAATTGGDPSAARIVVPEVEGEGLAVAEAELTALGLRASAPSDDPQAKVTDQTPAAGSRVSAGSVIALTLSGRAGPGPDPGDLKGLADALDPGLHVPGAGATATSGSDDGSTGGGATATPSDSAAPSDSPSASPEPSDSQEPTATPPPGPIHPVGP
jgi:serine/threonine-protein kinase